MTTALIGSATAKDSAGWDTIATLTSWINWRFIAQRQRYADLFSSPTAFEHFWSLSLEEQCFLFTPVLALAVAKFRTQRAGLILAAASAAIAALPLVWKQSPDTVYYGTHVRIGEFIAGAALAVLLPLAATTRSPRTTRLIRWWAPISLAGLIVVMLTIPREQAWLYRGGLGLMIVPAVGILAGAVTSEPITTRILSFPPLVTLGRAALSIYAIHWPVFLLIAHYAPDLDGAVLQVLQLAVSIAGGLALFRWFEQPLMRASRVQHGSGPVPGAGGGLNQSLQRIAWSSPRRSLVAMGAVGVVLVAGAWMLRTDSNSLDFDTALAAHDELINDSANNSSDASTAGGSTTRFAIFGGSAAVNLWFAGDEWLSDHERQLTEVGGDTQLGCGLLVDGIRYSIVAPIEANDVNGGLAGLAMKPTEPPCLLQPELWPKRIREFRIETALYVSSTWDIGTWIFDQESGVSQVPGDTDFDRRLRAAMEERFDAMHEAGLDRLLVTNLCAAPPAMDDSLVKQWEQRSDRYESILRSVASTREWIEIIDQRTYTKNLGDERFTALYPDGIHVSIEEGREVWDDLLAPFVLEN